MSFIGILRSVGDGVRAVTTEAPAVGVKPAGQDPRNADRAPQDANSDALFAAEIQSFMPVKYRFVGVSAVVSSSCCYAQQLFKRRPFKMTFAGLNPPCPATQCGLSYAISGFLRTADIPRG